MVLRLKLNRPAYIAVDSINNLLVVTNRDRILVFNCTDGGDVAPLAVISGPKAGIYRGGSRPSRVTVYPEGKKIFVTVQSSKRIRGGWQEGYVAVWKYEDRGDVPPWVIIKNSATTKLENDFGDVALNPEAKEIMVVNSGHPPALVVYHLPQVFE